MNGILVILAGAFVIHYGFLFRHNRRKIRDIDIKNVLSDFDKQFQDGIGKI